MQKSTNIGHLKNLESFSILKKSFYYKAIDESIVKKTALKVLQIKYLKVLRKKNALKVLKIKYMEVLRKNCTQSM